VGGNATAKVVKPSGRLQRHAFDGIVSVCPYYNRPSQDGLREHFTRIAEATDRPILIYNIPYRTSVNMSTDTLSSWPGCPTSWASRIRAAASPSPSTCCADARMASRS
jgi:Dihydrodipicolinate synthase/N-acetylneuraminate lyase